MSTTRIPAADLERLMAAALTRSGASRDMARATAKALSVAEQEGLASHGASRIPQYCGHLSNGRATGAAIPTVARDSKGHALTSAAQFEPQMDFDVVLRDGLVGARVSLVQKAP